MKETINITDFKVIQHPPESYSRELDNEVALQEMPYGYTAEPPPADTGDFDQARLESSRHYMKRYK